MFDPRKLLDMVKNASETQKNLAEKLKKEKATGEAMGGMVTVVINGQFELENISIDDKLLTEEKHFIEDVLKSAVNDATAKIRENMSAQLKSIVGNLGL